MSSKFESALKNTLNNEVSITENGACGFKTSGKKLLDINFAVSSLRSMKENEIETMFSAAFYENLFLALRWLFMLRDIRGNGMGERRSFRICMKWLALTRPDIVTKLVGLIAEYGRFDDLFCLIGTTVENEVVNVIDDQWVTDVKNMNNKQPISLLAKWMPSITTSSKDTVKLAKFFCKKLNLSERNYRKTLSSMRKYLNIVEQKMSAKKWNEIDYEAVPSQANIKYNAAFLRNDEDRRRNFLDALEKGEAKINASTSFPSDIVHAYTKKTVRSNWYSLTYVEDATLEAMWKALPNYIKDIETGSTICVADGSGSMTCSAGSGSTMSCLEVANSLAIYFAEKLNGVFKDKYITFSERPQYVDFSNAKSLAEKLSIAHKHNEVANTNIEAVFNLLLQTAIDNKLKQEDIPSNILVISDMEFDAAQGHHSYSDNNYSANQNALFKIIEKKWTEANYKFPRLIFWNVNSRTKTIPLQENENGVALVSGYSPAIANMVFSAKLDPYEVLIDALNTERYDAIENAVKDII